MRVRLRVRVSVRVSTLTLTRCAWDARRSGCTWEPSRMPDPQFPPIEVRVRVRVRVSPNP